MPGQSTLAVRQRFSENMRVIGPSPKRQAMCPRLTRAFTRFIGRSPDTAPDIASSEGLRAFQLNMADKSVGAPTFNNGLSVLSSFLSVTCARKGMKKHMRHQRITKKITEVLSAQEVTRIIEAAPGPGLRFRTTFGAV